MEEQVPCHLRPLSEVLQLVMKERDGSRPWRWSRWSFGSAAGGTTILVVDFSKAFESVQLSVVSTWAMYFGFPWRVLRRFYRFLFRFSRVIGG